MGIYEELVRGRRRPSETLALMYTKEEQQREKQIEKRADLLARPDLLEQRVATHAQMLSLSTQRARSKRGESRIDVLERQNEGTPMEGFSKELLDAYTAALEDPSLLKLSDRQLLATVTDRLVRTEPKGKGSSRLEESYVHKWRSDTGLGNLFGMFGEDEDVKKLPGYEQYLEQRKAQPVEEWHTTPGTAAGIGAGFTGALMLGSRVLGRTAMFAPVPGARLAGAALMAIPEFMAFDAIHNVLAKTEWGRAREGTYKKVGADLLVGGGLVGSGAMVARVAVKKAAVKLSTSKIMRDMFMKSPTARAAILASDAKKAADVAQIKADQAIVKNIGKEEVFNEFVEFDQVLKNIAAEKRFAEEIARPTIPRFPGPGLVAPVEVGARVSPEITVKANKFVKSILEDQGSLPALTKRQAAKVLQKSLLNSVLIWLLKKHRGLTRLQKLLLIKEGYNNSLGNKQLRIGLFLKVKEL